MISAAALWKRISNVLTLLFEDGQTPGSGNYFSQQGWPCPVEKMKLRLRRTRDKREIRKGRVVTCLGMTSYRRIFEKPHRKVDLIAGEHGLRQGFRTKPLLPH